MKRKKEYLTQPTGSFNNLIEEEERKIRRNNDM